MPVFKRRNETPLERELTAARERLEQLQGRRIDAQRALDLAIAERRRTLVEADLDEGRTGKDLVLAAREQVDGLSDAVELLEARIKEFEAKIAAEQVKSRRMEAATELGRHADQLAAAINALALTVAPLAKAIPHVVGRDNS